MEIINKKLIGSVKDNTDKSAINTWTKAEIIPSPKQDLFVPNNKNGALVILSIVSFVSLAIMVLTKLCPIFKTSWPQDFCDRWNDFWFGLSASIVAAIIFYLVFTVIPERAKRKDMEPLIHSEVGSIVLHMNMMIAVAKKRILTGDLRKKSFVKELLEFDWEENNPDYFDEMVDKPFKICIFREVDYAKNKLKEIALRFDRYLDEEERSFLSQDLLHHKLFQVIMLTDPSKTLEDNNKEKIANELYDFILKLMAFACRFEVKEIPDSYSL